MHPTLSSTILYISSPSLHSQNIQPTSYHTTTAPIANATNPPCTFSALPAPALGAEVVDAVFDVALAAVAVLMELVLLALEAVEAVDAVDAVDAVEPVEAVVAVDAVEALDAVEAVDPVEAEDWVDAVDMVEPVDALADEVMDMEEAADETVLVEAMANCGV